MMRYLKHSIILFFFLLSGFGLLGQTGQTLDSLSSNSETFFTQLSGFLLHTPSKTYQKRSQKLLDRFYASWSVGRFNKEEKQAIRQLVEKMRRRKMRTFPTLYNYVYNLTLLAESNQPPPSILSWHHYASVLLNDKKLQGFYDFLQFNRKLFERHTFYDKKSFTWYYRLGRFRFYDDSTFQLRFDHLNLVIASRRDSTVFPKTKGIFDYDHKLWLGQSGRLNWGRFGADYRDKIFAAFDNYRFDVTASVFEIDSARLFYKRFFDHPIEGELTERVMVSPPSKRSSYPRFKSYKNDFERKNIYPKIDYFGGYEIQGLNVYGKGGKRSKPEMHLFYGQKPVCLVKSELFKLGEKKTNAKDAEISFYLDADSIYHSGLHFRYSSQDKQAVFFSARNRSEPAPFYDSYHKLDLYVPAIYWHMESDSIVFKRLRGVNPINKAKFKSANFFSPKVFYQMQGIDEVNPMYVFANFAQTFSTRTIPVDAMAGFMEKPPEQITSLMIRMAQKGFLVYDAKRKSATLKDRFYDFLNAKAGRIDYDVLHFNSTVVAGANASLNLKSDLLAIYGVPQIYISDSQNVYIYPYDKRVAVRKNRDFSFNGRVHTGLFDFYAHQSTFIYDSFMLTLNYVDSMAFRVKQIDTVRNKVRYVRVKNVLQHMNATIYIDKPDNKSGKKHFAKYPILVSHDDSYVYYNKKEIQDSTLWPEKFYYKVDPFVFDSLLTFSTAGLAFKGELHSGPIFPIIKEPLKVLSDYSLGFHHKTTENGYPLYNGKATFGRDITLDNSGFSGSGKLHYLNLTTSSDHFVFYPDSLYAFAWDFSGQENLKPYDFPYLDADSVYVHWNVDSNIMTVSTITHPFVLYSTSTFGGIMNISPQLMKGDGIFHFDRASISSKDIRFKHSSLTADSSDFVLSDSLEKKVEFAAQGYYASIDFDKQKGWFNHLYSRSYLKFPANQYISTLDEVEWLMNEDRLELSSKADTSSFLFSKKTNVRDLVAWRGEGPEFISVNPHQDSLRFYAKKAWYNIRQTSIDVTGVPLIKVADAALFPFHKSLKITAGAHIETLKNAVLLMDTSMFYHTVYNADVDIFSRYRYQAKGLIDYVDENGTRQPIQLSSVSVDSTGTSVGIGNISEDEMLFLNPYYFYYGKVRFAANRRFLHFSGFYRLNQDCTADVENWVNFEGEINPQEVTFGVGNSLMGRDSLPMHFGLAFDEYQGDFYPLIPGHLLRPDDGMLLSASGILDYNAHLQSYEVGSAQRLKEHNPLANFIALNTRKCVLSGDGPLNLGLKIPMIKITSVGDVKYEIIPHKTSLKTYLAFDFLFDKTALQTIADSLRHFSGKSANLTTGVYPVALRKLLGNQKGGLALNELSLYGKMKKIPQELKATLTFPEVDMVWDKASESYLTKGKIAIGNVGDDPVNKLVDGYIQLRRGRSGSEINILLMDGPERWYFFSYAHQVLQFVSSDLQLNDAIANLKEDKRVLNPHSDENYYEFVISTKRKMIDFLRKMEAE